MSSPTVSSCPPPQQAKVGLAGGPGSVSPVEQAFERLRSGARLVSIFGSVDREGALRVHYALDGSEPAYHLLNAPARPAFPSATAVTPAASWYERELHDQYGIEIEGHPDLRPLLFHENWPAGVHPMVQARPAASGEPRPPYPFLRVGGEGVCEVPVGPVHAGIIEPGHFRFSVAGDRVLHLELRHFYTHKGTERLFEGAPVARGAMLAESVSGDNCISHAVAYCQAVESALGIDAPPRAQALRVVGLELERLAAHIADVGALCGDVGFSVPAAYAAALKEKLLQASTRFFGTRFWRAIAVPGGVRCDLGAEAAQQLAAIVADVERDFAELARMVLDTPSVQNRFETTGILKADIARDLAVVGPVARASGISIDVRRDHPYGLYREMDLEVPLYRYGDVLARARIRIDEAKISTELIDMVLRALPFGPVRVPVRAEGEAEGFSAVESPRGELFYWVHLRDNKILRCHIKSPSFQNWPALPWAMPGNIIADFPLVNKSFNLSYSGCDR